MKFEIHIHHYIETKETMILSSIHDKTLSLLAQTLEELKELKKLQMKTQADINKLTEDVKANTAGIKDALLEESEEIKAAIASQSIDTTELEAAVAENKKLAASVRDIFTPEGEEETPAENLPTKELPAEESPAGDETGG